PHSWFHIEVKDPDGQVVEWMIEGGSPNSLIRQGVTKNSIPIGTELTIEAYQAKDATNKAVGRNFILPDGKRLFVGSPGSPDAPPTQERDPQNEGFSVRSGPLQPAVDVRLKADATTTGRRRRERR